MACPVCANTLNLLDAEIFWCPRCGTLKMPHAWDTPRLVEHVVGFLAIFGQFLKDIELEEPYCTPQHRQQIGLLKTATADLLEATKYAGG